MTFKEELFGFRELIQDAVFYLRILKAHKENDIKLRNPHCHNWKICELDDCFMCINNLKGSEQYGLEKLINRIIKEVE